MGSVYELLHQPAPAREWHLKALAEYRKIENEPNLNLSTKREMEALSAVLAGGKVK